MAFLHFKKFVLSRAAIRYMLYCHILSSYFLTSFSHFLYSYLPVLHSQKFLHSSSFLSIYFEFLLKSILVFLYVNSFVLYFWRLHLFFLRLFLIIIASSLLLALVCVYTFYFFMLLRFCFSSLCWSSSLVSSLQFWFCNPSFTYVYCQ